MNSGSIAPAIKKASRWLIVCSTVTFVCGILAIILRLTFSFGIALIISCLILVAGIARLVFAFHTRNVGGPNSQFGISSTKLNEQQTFDIVMNQIRVGLISVPGISIPYPYGGKQRVVSVDLDPKAVEANNMQCKANFSKFQHTFAGRSLGGSIPPPATFFRRGFYCGNEATCSFSGRA
jgi:short repeat uncharacterized protein DUF308